MWEEKFEDHPHASMVIGGLLCRPVGYIKALERCMHVL